MKLIDCFIFYNELDLLEYRMELLYDVVDFFVLVESNYTHSGKEKKLYYNENKERYEKYNNKIIHIIEDTLPYIFPNINYNKNQQWVNEKHHRNCITKGLKILDINNEDIFTITDLDEIPDPKTLENIKKGEIIVTIHSLEQDMYYYNLNSKLLNKWYHPKIMSFEYFKNQDLTFSQIRIEFYSIIFNGGWHLSYFGDKYEIQNKIIYFAHQEFNKPEYLDLNKIQKNIENSNDVYNRLDNPIEKINIQDNFYLPPNYETKLQKYIIM